MDVRQGSDVDERLVHEVADTTQSSGPMTIHANRMATRLVENVAVPSQSYGRF